MEPYLDVADPVVPPAEAFSRAVEHVQAYVRSEPGAYSRLMAAAQDDPEGMVRSLVALGAVLLDISAGAFQLSPDEMLRKVSEGIAEHAGP